MSRRRRISGRLELDKGQDGSVSEHGASEGTASDDEFFWAIFVVVSCYIFKSLIKPVYFNF